VSKLVAEGSPGSITLFKGIDQARLRGVFDHTGINIASWAELFSEFPSDFSDSPPSFYFITELQIAERYANYAKNRSNLNPVVIIHLTISNQKIESLEI
jgi:hypothetical protein